jgi:16S rRNA (adenine1518-N6/adenine1519-N6)-dimethyltransferase
VRDARALLREANLHAKKSFGQNFLVNAAVVENIARACVTDSELGKAEVVELGAGLGVLTSALARRARRVMAVERDRDLVPILEREMGEAPVRVIEADAQTVDVAFGPDASPRVLAGNLPYQITGRLLERAVVLADTLDRVVFMVQREVADRLAADAGTKAYGALTVFVRAAFRVEKLFDVSPGSFHPPPDVTSSVVRLEPHRPRVAEETELFRALVKAAFQARRKTLRNAWSRIAETTDLAAAAERARVSLDARGETLDVEAYARMEKALKECRTGTPNRSLP